MKKMPTILLTDGELNKKAEELMHREFKKGFAVRKL